MVFLLLDGRLVHIGPNEHGCDCCTLCDHSASEIAVHVMAVASFELPHSADERRGREKDA